MDGEHRAKRPLDVWGGGAHQNEPPGVLLSGRFEPPLGVRDDLARVFPMTNLVQPSRFAETFMVQAPGRGRGKRIRTAWRAPASRTASARLRESEARYRAIFEAGPFPKLVYDPTSFAILAVNDAVVELYGHRRDELLAMTLKDLLPPEHSSKLTAALAQPLPDRYHAGVWTHRTKEGALIEVDVHTHAMVLEGRAVRLAELQDVTEAKRAEAALAERTRQLDAVRAVSAGIAQELDLTRFLRLLIGRAAELVGAASGTVYLWEPEQEGVVPMAWHGLGDWQANLRHPLGRGIAGTVAQTRQGLCVNDYRTSRYANPATLQHTRVTASLGEPLLYREALIGAITLNHEDGRSFTAQDQDLLRLFATHAAIAIGNARLHQAAVRRGAELEALLTATHSVMSGLDLQDILDRIVAEAHRISGAPHVKILLLDRPAGVLRVGAARGTAHLPGETLPLDGGLSAHVVRSGEPLYLAQCAEDPRNRKAARDRTLGMQAYLGLPITRGDEILGVLTFNTTVPKAFSPAELAYLTSFADQAALAIEKARLFEELHESYARLQAAQTELVRSEKLRGLGQMAAGIAHDLNNMLAAILGQVELLKLRGAPAEFREGLLTLETAAADGAQVVRRLQDFARLRTASPLAPTDLGQAIQEALDITAPRWKDEIQRRGFIIHVHVDLGTLPPILGHAPEIREARTNLIFNAVDAMPDGGTLTFAGAADPEGISLRVTDTGTGMPEAVRQQIFEPFFTTKGVRGTGLGLSVVYGIMERHGGRVDVASVPGQGTVFTLRFQEAPALAGGGTPAHPPAASASRCILLIDDDPAVRLTMTELLQAAGHTVLVAESGPVGLAQLAQTLPDLVLTDLGMPEMSGAEVARRVKSAHPQLPVLLLTGWGETAALSAADRQAVDRVLGKPVRLADLLQAVAELTETVEPAAP